MTARCDAEKAAERIRENQTITEMEILQIEIFLRQCCKNCQVLNRTLNKFLADKKRRSNEANCPTTSEETKKAKWWQF